MLYKPSANDHSLQAVSKHSLQESSRCALGLTPLMKTLAQQRRDVVHLTKQARRVRSQALSSPHDSQECCDFCPPKTNLEVGLLLSRSASVEICRKISQNFSPAGVTSPFVARAIPTDCVSVVPVRGR